MNNYFTLQRLSAPSVSDLGKTFSRAAELLADSKEHATLQFRIVGDAPGCWTIVLDGSGARAIADTPAAKPDFEIVTSTATWQEIADGKLAPLRAFTQGRMRVRGNFSLGEQVLQRLSKRGAHETGA
jgi:putative sterol carrier protein